MPEISSSMIMTAYVRSEKANPELSNQEHCFSVADRFSISASEVVKVIARMEHMNATTGTLTPRYAVSSVGEIFYQGRRIMNCDELQPSPPSQPRLDTLRRK